MADKLDIQPNNFHETLWIPDAEFTDCTMLLGAGRREGQMKLWSRLPELNR